MLRRCLATPRPSFGMIPPPRAQPAHAAAPDSGNDYGTMLEIRNVQMLPDGRSIVETWGTFRFRIMERGVLDGYTVGRVERVEDLVGEEADAADIAASRAGLSGASAGAGPSAAAAASAGAGASAHLGSGVGAPPAPHGRTHAGATNEELVAVCLEFLEELKEGTPWVGQHLNASYVPMPRDVARFSFWMALVRASFPVLCQLQPG